MTATAPNQTNSNGSAALPVRRVGSLTLGVCLIAAGVFFFAYYFVPGFDGTLALKIAPAAALCLMGCEVLYFSARPGRMKYDFLSVLICLLLVAASGCAMLLPQLWDEISPRRRQQESRLAGEYVDELYAAFEKSAPEIALRDMTVNVGLYTSASDADFDGLPGNYYYLHLNIELYGPYTGEEATADFAGDCFALLKVIKQQPAVPTRVVFSCEGQKQSFSLDVNGAVQQNWSAAELAAATDCFEAENAASASETSGE